MSRKVLGSLSNWGKPLLLSYISCEMSGNFKFSCGATDPKYFHIFLAPWATEHIGFYCNVLLGTALLCPRNSVYRSCPYIKTVSIILTTHRIDRKTDN